MTAGGVVARTVLAVGLTVALAAGWVAPSAVAAPSSLTIVHPLSGSSTDSQTPLFEGHAEDSLDPVSLHIYAGSSAQGTLLEGLGGPVLPVAGGWLLPLKGSLEPGRYTAVAEQTPAESEPIVSEPVTFTVDITPPAVSLSAVGSPTSDSTPALSGSAGTEEGDLEKVVVQIHQGPTVAGAVVREAEVAVSGGVWSYTVSPKLSDGTYTASVAQADEAGNTGKSPTTATFTLDTTAPAVSISAVGSPTSDSTPTLDGSAGTEEGDLGKVVVQIHQGPTVAGAVVREAEVAVSGGVWSYTVSPKLSDGTYTASVAQADAAGNTGKSPTTATFTLDTTAPTVTITEPAFGAVPEISRPPISGHAGTAGGDQTTIKLSIFAGTLTSGTPEQTVQLTASGGKWSTGPTGPSLADGIYTVLAEQEDSAGNVGHATTTFTVKTSSPKVTLGIDGAFKASGGRVFSAPTPTFSGSAGTGPEDGESVTVRIFTGTSTAGSPLESLEAPREGANWSIGPVARLADGTYTAQAVQSDSDHSGQPGVSEAQAFIVDGEAPHVTIASPGDGSSVTGSSQTLTGAAGTAEGDAPEVTVRLYAGTAVAGTALQSASVPMSGGGWSASFADLSPGVYTARAQQRDEVGNVGHSASVSFTVTAPGPAPAPAAPAPTPGPTAAFGWFPASPHVGVAVSLLSTSVASDSPLTAFAWAIGSEAAFVPAGPATVTTFASPGAHVVRLRVLDAAGRASVATETISVAPAVASLMQPFPIVRIAGSESAGGARISLLTVQTPAGSTARVSCRGRGCPARSQAILARAGRHTARSGVLIEFKHFERALAAGSVLQIRVFRAGQIGKYTRFTVRRGRLPVRIDMCLSPDTVKPIACPST